MLAVSVLFRLYRSKKTCPAEDSRKRNELAADLVELLCRWLPSNRHHMKTQIGLWYESIGSSIVRMFVTRNPRGRMVVASEWGTSRRPPENQLFRTHENCEALVHPGGGELLWERVYCYNDGCEWRG